mgnify:CR=1 FL=1
MAAIVLELPDIAGAVGPPHLGLAIVAALLSLPLALVHGAVVLVAVEVLVHALALRLEELQVALPVAVLHLLALRLRWHFGGHPPLLRALRRRGLPRRRLAVARHPLVDFPRLLQADFSSAVGEFSIRFWIRNPNRNRFPQTESDSDPVTGVKFVRSALRNGSGRRTRRGGAGVFTD